MRLIGRAVITTISVITFSGFTLAVDYTYLWAREGGTTHLGHGCYLGEYLYLLIMFVPYGTLVLSLIWIVTVGVGALCGISYPMEKLGALFLPFFVKSWEDEVAKGERAWRAFDSWCELMIDPVIGVKKGK